MTPCGRRFKSETAFVLFFINTFICHLRGRRKREKSDQERRRGGGGEHRGYCERVCDGASRGYLSERANKNERRRGDKVRIGRSQDHRAMNSAGSNHCIRPPLYKQRASGRVTKQFDPRPAFWSSLGRSLRIRGGILPPQRQRFLVLLFLAAGAYCLLLHQQQQQQQEQQQQGPLPPMQLVLSSHGNRSRALTAFGDNASASHKMIALDERANGIPDGSYPSGEENGVWDSEMEEELNRRRVRVWEVCKANGMVGDENGAGEPNAWEFFIDEKHHLVWCNIFKAASSSWMYNFNLLGGFKEQYLRRSRKSPLTMARTRFPRPSVEQLKSALPHSLSFLIVRDPFERLLSAYRNKIEGFRHKYYRKMAKEMITKFRVTTSLAPGIHRNHNGEKSPTFSEFVSWVIASAKESSGIKDGGSKGVPGFDEHWAPYFRFCTPCAVNFTVIAKMETLSRDEAYIIQKTGIGATLGMTGEKQGTDTTRPREAVNAAIGGRTEEVLPRYFRTLTREQLDALYDIYRIDFQMFGYDASKYFDMVPA